MRGQRPLRVTEMTRRRFLRYSVWLAAGSAFPRLCGCGGDQATRGRTGTLPESGGDLLLSNASIIDVETGRLRPEDRILIREGRILELSAGAGRDLQAARNIDLGGAYVIPGLINAHCHMSMPCTLSDLGPDAGRLIARQTERNAEECIRHGVTTVRDMMALSDWVYELKEKIDRGEILGPRVLTSYVLDVPGGYFGGMLALIGDERFGRLVSNTREGVEGVRAAAEAGADLIKLADQAESLVIGLPRPRQMSLEVARAICEEASRHGIPVALHHTDTRGLAKGLAAGIRSFEHMAIDRVLNDEEIARILDQDVYFVPTESVGYACSYETRRDPDWNEGLKAWVKEARLTLLPSMLFEYCEPEVARAALKDFASYCDPAYFDQAHPALTLNVDAFATGLTTGVSNMQALYEAGVRFGCGNDGGIPFDFPGAMALEMSLLEKAGLDPRDVLRMATIQNARLVGMESEIGTVEKGKVADLVILERNPLESFENAFRPRMVLQAGRIVFSST